MGRFTLVVLGALLGVHAAWGAADSLVVLYNGTTTVPPQTVLGDWGFTPREKMADAYKPIALGRGYALPVSMLGRYQGVRFDFPQPLDSAQLFNGKNTYLEVYLRAADKSTKEGDTKTTTTDKGRTTTTPPVDTPPPPNTTMPPMVPPTIDQPGGGPKTGPGAIEANAGGLPAGMAPPRDKPLTVPLPKLTNLRLSFFTEKGQGLLTVTPDQFFPKEEVNNRWVRVDIPLSLLNPQLPIGGKLTRMLLTSDAPAEFLIGRLAFVQDTTPLTVKMTVFPLFMEAGKRIFFLARVEAGLSHYETTWNFGATTPDKVDATGDRVTYTYDKEGNYVITCKVRDINGGKDAVSTSLEVKVTRAR